MEEFPNCLFCNNGVLLPLSDYGRGSEIRYKAWVCSNPECGYQIRIDNGEVSKLRDIREQRKRERHSW